MKLVDILARELKVWPDGEPLITQSAVDEEIYGASGMKLIPSIHLTSRHTEAVMYPEVTRAQWQAAVDALDIPKFSDDKVEWNGEGLPPVGAVVNIRFPEYASLPRASKILHVGKRSVFYVDQPTGDEFAHSIDELEFSLARTPEQIAAEHKSLSVSEIVRLMGCPHTVGADIAAGRIYDAGYRKQEKGNGYS